MKRLAIILAGGSGERFWPLSQKGQPKQFLSFSEDGKSLLRATVDRVRSLGFDSLWIVTSAQYAERTAAEVAASKAEVFIEPYKRNTAGAIAWATAHALARGYDHALLSIFPSDHWIADEGSFARVAEAALAAAESSEALVVLGMRPDRAHTGYGYIELSESAVESAPCKVARFHEKPAVDAAERYLATGRHLWNSGMFFWRIGTFLSQLVEADRTYADAIAKMSSDLAGDQVAEAQSIFESLPDISIDRLLLERSSQLLAIPADLGWEDLGSIDALERLTVADHHGNAVAGHAALVDASDNLVVNRSAKPVGAVGISGLMIVVTDDGVLVCPKDQAQRVRDVVRELESPTDE